MKKGKFYTMAMSMTQQRAATPGAQQGLSYESWIVESREPQAGGGSLFPLGYVPSGTRRRRHHADDVAKPICLRVRRHVASSCAVIPAYGHCVHA